MYKIAICDDEIRYLEIVEKKVREYCKKNHLDVTIKIYSDSDMLAEDIEQKKMFDVYILDIEMKRYSGIEIAKLIDENTNSGIVIFLTAYRDYAIEAVGLNVMRYILKERIDEELSLSLDEAFRRLHKMQGENAYIINNQRKFIKLLDTEIIYIYKNQKNAVFVLTGGREEKDRHTLQDVYEKIKKNKTYFFLDRGIILNLYHVHKIMEDEIKMTDGYTIISSKGRIAELKRHIHLYWGDII